MKKTLILSVCAIFAFSVFGQDKKSDIDIKRDAQVAEIIALQDQIDTELTALEEDVRLAWIFASRGGKVGK